MSEEKNEGVEIPRYKSHKEVRALKIKSVQPRYDRNDPGRECYECRIGFEDPRFAPINESGDYFRKHSPEPGGYYVVYPDGYKSFSPAEPFESGYTAADQADPAEEVAPEHQVLMRAKMIVDGVKTNEDGSENLKLRAVCKDDGYDESGKDENNSFARFTPTADLTMHVNNPDLNGLMKEGMQFYLQFIPAPPVAVPAVDPHEVDAPDGGAYTTDSPEPFDEDQNETSPAT